MKRRASIAERARSRPSPEPNPFRQRSSSKKSRRVDRRQLRPQVFRQPRRAEAAKIGVEIVTLRLERVDRDAGVSFHSTEDRIVKNFLRDRTGWAGLGRGSGRERVGWYG